MIDDAESIVVNIIYQVNGVLPNKIRRQDNLIRDLVMDSVEIIDLLMHLEELGIIIPESEINGEMTVDDIIRRVEQTILKPETKFACSRQYKQ